jgi:signal transduction histidine kinase/DNA-binding response OmpR family regulator
MAEQQEKILVVESDPIIADLIARQALDGQGFVVKVVEEASTAIQQATAFEPDVVIANIDLPGLSGKDLIAALSYQNVEIPVIMISSKGQEKDVIRAFRLGASDFISMPIRETEVVSVVERALETVRARKEREHLARRLKHANQRLNTRIEQLTTVFAIGKAVTSVFDQTKLFRQIVEEAVHITQANYGWFLNRDTHTSEFILRAQVNLPKSLLQHMNKPWNDGISSLVARSGETFSIHGKAMERFMLYSLGKSALVVPVKAHDETIGLLVVMRKRDREFQAGDRTMLEGVSDYAAISMVNARLFQALDERAATLQVTVEKTREEERMKDQVIYLVNQEMRSPLLAARDHLTRLLEGEQGRLNKKQIESLELARKKLNKIVQITQTMKFLRDAGAPQESSRLDLTKLINQAVERWIPTADVGQIILIKDIPEQQVFAAGDPNQIPAVLDALLSNAIKFSRKGGHVVVTHVSIKDEGIGISKKNLEKVFTRFYQVDSSATRKYEGLGIGLALVRQVIEGHGGKVWVESMVEKGSTFHFALPEYK